MSFLHLFALVVTIILAVKAEYPANFPKCKNANEPCLVNAANEILQNYHTGLPEINLVSIDPLHVKSIILEANPESPVNIEVKLTDIELTGMKTLKVSSFKGLNSDFSGRSALVGKISHLALKGHYNINGTALIIPITGNGNMEIVFKNADYNFSFGLKPVEKDGKTYAALEQIKLEMQPENIHFHFDNLFNGDQLLTDTTNTFLNANWHEIYEELKPGILRGIARVTKAVFNNFLKKYPYSDYFL